MLSSTVVLLVAVTLAHGIIAEALCPTHAECSACATNVGCKWCPYATDVTVGSGVASVKYAGQLGSCVETATACSDPPANWLPLLTETFQDGAAPPKSVITLALNKDPITVPNSCPPAGGLAAADVVPAVDFTSCSTGSSNKWCNFALYAWNSNDSTSRTGVCLTDSAKTKCGTDVLPFVADEPLLQASYSIASDGTQAGIKPANCVSFTTCSTCGAAAQATCDWCAATMKPNDIPGADPPAANLYGGFCRAKSAMVCSSAASEFAGVKPFADHTFTGTGSPAVVFDATVAPTCTGAAASNAKTFAYDMQQCSKCQTAGGKWCATAAFLSDDDTNRALGGACVPSGDDTPCTDFGADATAFNAKSKVQFITGIVTTCGDDPTTTTTTTTATEDNTSTSGALRLAGGATVGLSAAIVLLQM